MGKNNFRKCKKLQPKTHSYLQVKDSHSFVLRAIPIRSVETVKFDMHFLSSF